MQDAEYREQPVAGQAVGAAGHVTEGAIQQVESAVKQAALTGSQSGLARVIGLARASQTVIDGALESGLNIAQSGRQNITGDFATDAINELEKFRQKIDEAIEQLGAQQNR